MAKKAYVGIGDVAKKVKKIYIGVVNNYECVEYIESSGTQYIDTGFAPNQDTRVVMHVNVPTALTSTASLFGARSATASASYICLYTTSLGAWSFDYSTNANRYTFSGVVTGDINIDYNKNVVTVNGSSNTWTEASFQTNCNLHLLAMATNGKVDYAVAARLYSCQVYDNGTLIRDFVPVKSSSGVVGLYDKVNDKFYGNAGSGTFTAGATTGATFGTSGGVARKVKRAYIGVNGVAQIWWSGGLGYYGKATPLSVARKMLAATSIGDYALFAGGSTNEAGSAVTDTIDAYNKSLTRTLPTVLGNAKHSLAAVPIGDYALFAGGQEGLMAMLMPSDTIDAYNKSLTKTTPTVLGVPKYALAATVVGNYALFGGGYGGTQSYNLSCSRTVDAYNKSLTRSGPDYLSKARMKLAATSVGNYALFAGGNISDDSTTISAVSTVDAYNKSLTKTTPTSLNQARSNLVATSVGDYALFGGGITSNSQLVSVVDAYDTSLTRSTPTALTTARHNLSATSNSTYALFGGGRSDGAVVGIVDVYDKSLTRTTLDNFSLGKCCLAATVIGEYALFGGGESYDEVPYDSVEVYTME